MKKFLLSGVLILILSGCTPQNITKEPISPSAQKNEEGKQANTSTGIANPASVFCEKNGGKIEIRQEEPGGQVGFCTFTNGKMCEDRILYIHQRQNV